MPWITDTEYEAYHRKKDAARRGYIMRLARSKGLNAHAIAKGTGLNPSVVWKFFRGLEPTFRTYDRIRLFCENYNIDNN